MKYKSLYLEGIEV